MTRTFFSACAFAALLAVPAAADQVVLTDCSDAGVGATFCHGQTFAALDAGQPEGMSLWLHERGYLSKVLIEELADPQVTQGQIEGRIMALVSAQADHIGRNFEFEDISSYSAGGTPFGTISYSLRDAKGPKAILHSYVAAKGVVLQVISQIALKEADPAPDALRKAHAAALKAVHLAEPSVESEEEA